MVITTGVVGLLTGIAAFLTVRFVPSQDLSSLAAIVVPGVIGAFIAGGGGYALACSVADCIGDPEEWFAATGLCGAVGGGLAAFDRDASS